MPKFNKHIIIVGTARSGTSWLSETMAQQQRYRMLFEPEQEEHTKDGFLLCDQWIQKKQESKKAHNYLEKIFANRVDNDWIAQHSDRRFKRHLWPLIPKKFIIKFVRCNLSASYMNSVFGIPVIHVIRNPYEVLSSQSRANFHWLVDMTYFLEQEKLVTYIQVAFGLDLKKTSSFSHLQLKTLRWCIENVIPLKILEKSPSDNYVFIKYEDLAADINVFYDLCEQFDITYPKNIEDFFTLPSSKAHSKGTISKTMQRQKIFSASELNDINSILNIFGSKFYPIIR